ncbi:thiosulfate transporter TsuA-like [Haliotis cracherodii]|uniref:thiosulfate transporter TsuA-like n=1 Tax=Haliotis cracherodii TaxID=6455 RepID=UPI0039EAB25D
MANQSPNKSSSVTPDQMECGQSDCDGRERNSSSRVLLQIIVSAICGFLFGVALEKARVFEPESIRLQMVFEKWIMLKMFLAAVASGQLFLAILSVVPHTKYRFEQASSEFVQCFADKGLLTSSVGPLILGAGMTLGGACPGMVLIQVGAWVPNAIFTLLGALIGALLYGLVATTVTRITRPNNPFKFHQIHTKLNKPYIMFALPMAVMLGVVVFLLEFYIPYQQDVKRPEKLSYNIIKTIAWPPYVSGIIVGVLQMPVVLVLGDTIGGSTSYVTITSQWVVSKTLQKKLPYMAAKRTGIGNWWQVIYVCCAIIGGLVSAVTSHSLASIQGVGVLEGFFGGMLMLLGARLAAGCTSGHGLSGMGMLAWLSFIAVPFMFGGAIATAFIMRAVNGSLDRYVWTTLNL